MLSNRPPHGIDPKRLAAFAAEERARFATARPKSKAAFGNGIVGFLGGVPLHWMRDWPMPFLPVVKEAKGATITDIDGITLDDFCLGDTGSMFGHAPEPVVKAIAAQAGKGLTYMLPSEDTLAVGRLLQERFGMPHWQVATTATDANRFALRVARAVTGRPKILVFNGCYHGTVDETFVRLIDGKAVNRPGMLGQFRDLTETTRVCEFNDIAALETVLSHGDVACVIAEPVMTNSCMVLPQPGYHEALRQITRRHGTLLLIDETHTISSGLGGYTRVHALEPDLFVLGKPIAGGVPASIWGMTEEVAGRLAEVNRVREAGHSGMGTTLSASALQMAAMRATLEHVMTAANYAHMELLAQRLVGGLAEVIEKNSLPWHAVRVGVRVEFICAPGPLLNGTEAEAAHAPDVEGAMHTALLNRGSLIAPFHNMMLVSPATSKAQIDRLIGNFADIASQLAA